jgi:hypothetical protein
MAYVIFDNDAPTGSRYTKIAANESARDKMIPPNMTQFYKVYDISDDEYNSLRLGNKGCTHDGTNYTIEDPTPPLEGAPPVEPLTEAKIVKYVSSYTETIRKHFESWDPSDTTRTDWLNYADTVDNHDYSTFSGTNMNEIIESKGTTFRSLSERPQKVRN